MRLEGQVVQRRRQQGKGRLLSGATGGWRFGPRQLLQEIDQGVTLAVQEIEDLRRGGHVSV
jgi:hypothetical protein